jgi:hypothetical protein
MILIQLGVDPTNPAARRMALTEINRLQHRAPAKAGLPLGSTGTPAKIIRRRRSSVVRSNPRAGSNP